MKTFLAILVCLSLVSCEVIEEASRGAGNSSLDEATKERDRSERVARRKAARAERRTERRQEARVQRREALAQRRAQAKKRRVTAVVSRVVDGDTIEVQLHGATVDIRLIGIDTPETVDPGEPVGCYGPEASGFTTESLEGEMVRLEYDVEREDQYGRSLAYVFVGNRLFNESLVGQGYAQVSTYRPNVKYVDRFLAAQRRARKRNAGLWDSCPAGGGSPSPIPSETQETPTTGGGNCDPNYSGACIPPYPPDLDCADVAQGFAIVGADPHGFDADGDGIACES